MPADPNFPLSEKFVVPATDRFPNARQLNYFTSCDPHHDIYTFSYWHIFWHSIWHIFWHSIWHSIWHIFWHSIWPLRSGSAHWDLELAVEARQCPLRPGSRGWGPAVPTCNSRLRPGSAHWDLELSVEVRLCPLGSGARGGGPAVPTGTGSGLRGGGGGWGGGGGNGGGGRGGEQLW